MLPGPKDPRVAYNGVKTCGGKGFHGHRQQETSQPTAEKSTLKKIILDTSWCFMVAETEDLITEYSMTREIITNNYVKEEEQESPYCKMRNQHLRDWPDDTLRIEEEGHTEALSKFQKQLQHFIASH